MHILHLIKTSEGATWAINQIKEIKRKFPEITFSVIIPDGGKHINEYYEVCKNVYLFDYKLNHTIFKKGFEFRKIVIKDNPDIIHSWFTQTTLYARFFLRNFKVPRLFQVVGPLHLENKIFKFFDIKSAQANDYWIATSKYIYNKYSDSGVQTSKLFLNYAYIDVSKILLHKELTEVLDFRNQYDIPEDYKIIGTASYIYPPKFYEKVGLKGHEQLLEVFKEILKKRKEIVLVIAGCTFGGNTIYENRLKEKAKLIDEKRIIFTGKYTDVYSVIANFDVFIYLSKSENLGGVFESLLFEIPTVSSNRGALPELVINNFSGYNVGLEHNNEIVDKIIATLEENDLSMMKNGKQKVLELFEKESLIQKALEIYQLVKK
jgi:glycosyltransferase involved in cell wall biosynthesis